VGSLRIATFNIHRGLGTDDVLDLDRTAAAIRATGADVVALQELDRNLDRTGRIDQPALLAARVGLPIEFRPTLRLRDGEYGIGLLAEGLASVDWVRLPRVGREEPRGVIVGRLPDLWVCATHLSTRPEARRVQLRALARLVADLDGPVTVLGDLNAGRRELRPLRRKGLVPGPRMATFRGSRGRQIDYILTPREVGVERSWTVETDASDHLPLAAQLRF
jgi:endonuclease/exonuclease/phosphatase family metal-dependent hydrolase